VQGDPPGVDVLRALDGRGSGTKKESGAPPVLVGEGEGVGKGRVRRCKHSVLPWTSVRVPVSLHQEVPTP